ncbi:MAG: AzlC family ABC transporter permease [Ilumatobacteraceae bacterium]
MSTPVRGVENTYRAGLRAGLPIAIPTGLIGMVFGIAAVEAGWGSLAPVVMSLVVFAGSAQFALLSVLGDGGTRVAALVAATLVNMRFLVMGVALAPSLIGGRLRRAIEGQTLVDASFVIAANGDGTFARRRLIGATAPQFVAWISGTAIGVLAGDAIPDPEALGLDVLFPAFFLALLAAELRVPERRLVAAAAAVIALILVPLAPAGVPIVAACAAVLLAARR